MIQEAAGRPSPRERVLAAADELFYSEGVNTVGIDRIIARAGVAKASLYSAYGSKEALVCAYLRQRRERALGRVRTAVEARSDPRQRLLAVFDAQAEAVAEPGFRGCPFAAACAEAPEAGPVEHAAREYRGELRALLTELAAAAGAVDPSATALALQLIHDGVASAARVEPDRARVAAAGRAAAAALIDTGVKLS